MRRRARKTATVDELLAPLAVQTGRAETRRPLQAFDALTKHLRGKVRIGRKLTREESGMRAERASSITQHDSSYPMSDRLRTRTEHAIADAHRSQFAPNGSGLYQLSGRSGISEDLQHGQRIDSLTVENPFL